MLTELSRHHHNGRRNFGCTSRGHVKARHSAACTHPDAAAAIGEQRVTDAIIPEQSLSLAVVPPLLAIKHVDAIIRAGPQPSPRIGHEPRYLIRLQPVSFRKVLPACAVSIQSEPRNAYGFGVADPDAAVGGFRETVQGVPLQTIFRGEPPPTVVVLAQQAERSGKPPASFGIDQYLTERFFRRAQWQNLALELGRRIAARTAKQRAVRDDPEVLIRIDHDSGYPVIAASRAERILANFAARGIEPRNAPRCATNPNCSILAGGDGADFIAPQAILGRPCR